MPLADPDRQLNWLHAISSVCIWYPQPLVYVCGRVFLGVKAAYWNRNQQHDRSWCCCCCCCCCSTERLQPALSQSDVYARALNIFQRVLRYREKPPQSQLSFGSVYLYLSRSNLCVSTLLFYPWELSAAVVTEACTSVCISSAARDFTDQKRTEWVFRQMFLTIHKTAKTLERSS